MRGCSVANRTVSTSQQGEALSIMADMPKGGYLLNVMSSAGWETQKIAIRE